MQSEQLCSSGMTDTEHTTFGSNEEELFKTKLINAILSEHHLKITKGLFPFNLVSYKQINCCLDNLFAQNTFTLLRKGRPVRKTLQAVKISIEILELIETQFLTIASFSTNKKIYSIIVHVK